MLCNIFLIIIVILNFVFREKILGTWDTKQDWSGEGSVWGGSVRGLKINWTGWQQKYLLHTTININIVWIKNDGWKLFEYSVEFYQIFIHGEVQDYLGPPSWIIISEISGEDGKLVWWIFYFSPTHTRHHRENSFTDKTREGDKNQIFYVRLKIFTTSCHQTLLTCGLITS